MKTGVIVAMDKEFVQLKTILDDCKAETINGKDYFIGNLLHHRLILQKCGIGKVNAAIGTVEMINGFHPDLIVSSGVAGGAAIDMNPLDVVMGTEYRYHDVYCGEGNLPGQVQGLPGRFNAHPTLLSVATKVRQESDLRVREGLMCTGDQFITDRTRQSAIKAMFPEALACEMESAAIAHTCYLMDKPFLSIRVISDTPGNTDNHQQQWADFLNSMTDRSFQFVLQFLRRLPATLPSVQS